MSKVAPITIHAAPASASRAQEAGARDASSRAAPADEIALLWWRIAELSARQVDADEIARQSLARELHDGFGAELTGARLALANVCARLPADAAPQCADALARLRDALERANESIRDVLGGLAVPQLGDGLIPALADLADGFGVRAALRTSVVCAADARIAHLPRDASLALYRIAQEALTNIARHARASRADVRLDSTPRYLTLSIADDGVGLSRKSARQRARYGIDGMRARGAAFGGTLQLRTARGAGTTVTVRIAWKALLADDRAVPSSRRTEPRS